MRLGDVEEGAESDFSATVFEAVGILAVCLFMFVVLIEAAETMEDIAAIFAEFRDQGKGYIQPFRVSGCDVDA